MYLAIYGSASSVSTKEGSPVAEFAFICNTLLRIPVKFGLPGSTRYIGTSRRIWLTNEAAVYTDKDIPTTINISTSAAISHPLSNIGTRSPNKHYKWP